jgi:CheY-like chemotaxis protein
MPQVLVIDDTGFAGQLRDALGGASVTVLPAPGLQESPRQVAQRAVLAADGDTTLLCINIDLACAGDGRQHQAGVEVLKFLRFEEALGGVRNGIRDAHAILYSFRTLEQLIRHRSSNHILCSKGVTFRRLPFDPAQLPVQSLAADKAEPHELTRFVRGSLTLPDERHSWANWYSAWQMLNVHRLVMDQQAGAVDKFLFPVTEPNIRDALFVYGKPAGLREHAGEIKPQVEELRREISSNTARGVGGPLKVALLDDQAQQIDGRTHFGWHQVYSRMLEGTEVVDVLKQLGLDHETFELSSLLDALQRFSFHHYACVLLDLRLRGERGLMVSPETLSGAVILKWLRREWPEVPVIVTTASNKLRTYEDLVRLGADAYWMKHGMDERGTGEDLARAYSRLLELVAKVTGQRYQFVRRLGHALKHWMYAQSPRWWHDREWLREDDDRQRKDRDARITGMIRDVILMLRQYLHLHEIGYGYQDRVSEELFLLSIIQHAGKSIEAIHGYDHLKRGKRTRGTIGGWWDKEGQFTPGRGDWFAYYLMAVRNRASHYPGYAQIDWEALTTFVSHLACYLLHGPQVEFCDGGVAGNPPRFRLREDDELDAGGLGMVESHSEYLKLAKELRP